MTDEFGNLKILASRAAAQRISRRHFLAGSAVAVFSSSVLLAACGGDDALAIYNWAEYNDHSKSSRGSPTRSDRPPRSTIYDSNEEAIAKLEAAGGSSGYDIVVPSGVYVPQMAEPWSRWTSRPPELREPRGAVPARRAIRTTSTRSARTGDRPAGSTTPRWSPRSIHADFTDGRDGAGERQHVGARHARLPAGPSTSGPRASTG